MTLQIVEVTGDSLSDWKLMRQAVYPDVSDAFHDHEMELILAATDATCLLGFSDSGAAVAMLELSLRSHVDGCLGGPVGYVEGIYLKPEMRGAGHGRRLIDYAANWFRSRGCRDMAADAELDNTAAEDRFAGYRRALEDTQIPFNEDLVGIFEAHGEPVRDVVSRIMAHRHRPTAFVCSNDGAATRRRPGNGSWSLFQAA